MQNSLKRQICKSNPAVWRATAPFGLSHERQQSPQFKMLVMSKGISRDEGRTLLCCVASAVSDSVRPHRRQPTRLPRPWHSPGKNTGVGCHFLLQCLKVKSESEVAQSCPTPSDPMDCSPPGSSVHGIFQARVLEWGAIAFSRREGGCKIKNQFGHFKRCQASIQ